MKYLAALALVLASMSLACGSDNGPSTPATPSSIANSFNGTVDVGGSDVHNFTVTASSQVDVTLTAAAPPDGIIMGVGVGAPSGSPCTPFAGASVSTSAGSSAQLAGQLSPGSYCVVVFDVGNQTAPVSYTVVVVHK